MLGLTLVAPTLWPATMTRQQQKTMALAITCPVWCLDAPTLQHATLMRTPTTAMDLVNTRLVQVAPILLHAITIRTRRLQALATISILATDAQTLKLATTIQTPLLTTGLVRSSVAPSLALATTTRPQTPTTVPVISFLASQADV